MAKKIISFLCALAVLVSMVAVGMVASLADGGTTTLDLLDSANLAKWTLTRSCPNNWTLANFAGVADLSTLTPAPEGIKGALVHNRANHDQYTSVTFDYSDALNLGDDFSVLMTAFIKTTTASGNPDQDAYASLELGDYSVRLVHFVEDAILETGTDRDSFRIAIFKGDALVAVSDVLASDVTTSLYDGKVFTAGAEGQETNLWADTGVYGDYIRQCSIGAKGAAASGGKAYESDAGWKDIKVIVKDGKLSVENAAGACGLHVLASGESADDVTALTGFTATSVDLAAGTSFNGIKPKVVLNGDGVIRKNEAIALFRLQATYTESTVTPPPAGEEDDEEREGTKVNLLGSDVIKNWTITKRDKQGVFNGASQMGVVDMTKCSTTVEGWTGLLNAGRMWQLTTGEFSYGEKVSLTDDFELLTTGFIYGEWGAAIPGDPAIGTYYDIALGEYAIRVQLNTTRCATTDRCKFDIFLLKGGEIIGTSTGTTGDYWVTIGETTNLTGTTLAGGNMRDTIGTALASSEISKHIVANTYKYNPKTDEYTQSTGTDAGYYSYSGDYCNTAYTDLTIVVKDGKLSVKAVDGTVVEFAKGDDTFTTVDVAEGAFNYIKPVVTVYGPDSGMYSGKPIGILRLDATVYGEEPAPLPDPAVVTFNATKGTVDTATATVNEEGKLASLPTPTYTGAGTYTFDGWYTAEVGGTKITTDTVFAEDTTIYAQWTRTLTTTAMNGFDKATCELPEKQPWNSSGSGLFKTSGYGDGLIVGNQGDFGLTAELGTYNIDSYFKVDFDIWVKNKPATVGGTTVGSENYIITFGDLAITFTRSPVELDTDAGKNIYLQSITYKGQEVEIVGDKNFSPECATCYEHNSDFIIKNANEEFNQFLEDNMIRKGWMFNSNFWANTNHALEVTYDAGVLSIKNTSGTVTNAVSADLTKVAGFDVATAFNNAKVSARIEATAARGAFTGIISDFHGVYEKVAAQGEGSGSGTGTGTGTGTGNGGSNAPQTGDNRNVVLPICVAIASVAVAGATLIRRKRA